MNRDIVFQESTRHLPLAKDKLMGTLHSHALRRGRHSLAGHCYLITAVTTKRQPWFLETIHARAACRSFYAESVSRQAETMAFVVMPDHIHWLMQLHGNLSEAVRTYKAVVIRQVECPVWQRGFHDHCLRKEEDLKRVARYIVANPLRAGLVTSILDYPYWDAVWLNTDK